MPDRLSVRITQLLLGAALLMSFHTQSQTENLYRVELLVFSYPAGTTSEQWEATPELAYPQSTRPLMKSPPPDQTLPALYATLPPTQRELAGKSAEMQRSGRYQILFHETWIQPIGSAEEAMSIVLDSSGDGGEWPALQGTINLHMATDLTLDTNLWLNTQGEYLHSAWRMPPPPLGPPSLEPQSSSATAAQDRSYPFRHAVLLKQTQRMSSGEISYIDHPMLGVIAKVTALSAPGPNSPAVPETAAQPNQTAAPER